ncbi:MAG: SIMPL domain-containing protein [Paludibacteraceae bacterium]
MRKLFCTILVAVSVLLPTVGTAKTPCKTIVLRAEGAVEVVPDMAVITIGLTCLDKNIDVVRACADEQSHELYRQLQALGIDTNDIQTTSVGLRKSYRWDNGKQLFEGYENTLSYAVTVRHIGRLGELYAALLTNENVSLNGLHYTHSQMAALRNDAYMQALENANVLADKLLQTLPETTKNVVRISNVKIGNDAMMAEDVVAADAAYNALGTHTKTVSVANGLITVSATLFVEFCIK